MLAAGVGSRLAGNNADHLPKSLLEFGGKSLLRRHVDNLRALGVAGLSLVVGYKAETLKRALADIAPDDFVSTIHNPYYERGSVVSLWTAREVLNSGEDVLHMDADVLYHPDLLKRLVASPAADCFLLDRDFEDGDEPVRVCVKDGRLVEFRKAATGSFDVVGEWPGFTKMSGDMAAHLAGILEGYIQNGNEDAPCEDALRDAIQSERGARFGYEDITGLPWIEIDFPEDVERAERDILPRLPD